MRLLWFCFLILTVFEFTSTGVYGQDFEVPVQLIGFPVIMIAVKLSNFVKKLAYAVNPSTYHKRGKRSAFPDEMNVMEVERKLIEEMGEKFCVYENVCEKYAERANKLETENKVLDWDNVFAMYEDKPVDSRKYYLLSVFLGDIVGSPDLCRSLAKRGRSCTNVHKK